MKKMIISLLVLCTMLSAAFVSVDRAKNVAENYYRYHSPETHSGYKVTRIDEHEYKGQVTWYGVSFERGFVLVSADDAVKAILGYSYDGYIPEVDRPGGDAFKEWFGNYDKQIKTAREIKYVDGKAQKEWADLENNIFPKSPKSIMVDALVDSKWDQGWPWNDQCPEKDATFTYVGCVATSMSQILKYHNWPDTGVGTNSYSWNGTTISESFATSFDYSMMPNIVEMDYGLYPTYWETINMDSTEIDMLAKLNYLVGVSVSMSYGTTADGGSGAYSTDVDNSFLDHWKASSSVYTTVGTPTDPAQDAAAIRSELDAKRPWYWSGGVHAFILDGYTDDYWYHFNWGWAGSYDGWFQITYLVPDGQGTGGGDGDYTSGQARVSYVPSTDPYTNWQAPTNFSGSIVNQNDVSLSWNAPSGSPTGYNIFRSSNQGAAVLIGNTASTSYTDGGLVENTYSYYVTAVYAGGESHHTDSYEAVIAADPVYPVARSVAGTAVGRTSIDLTWVAPYVGVLNAFIDYEENVLPSSWTYQTSADGVTSGPPQSQHPGVWYGDDANCFTAHKDDVSWIYKDRIDGYFMLLSTASYPDYNQWWLSPDIAVNADHTISWWMRFRCTDDAGVDSGNYPAFEIVSYSGDFTEEGRESGIVYTSHADYVCSMSNENIWETEESVSLSASAGSTTKVGFRVYENPYYTFSLDNITIGSTSGGGDQPTAFDIYRNGSLANTTADGTTLSWSDTGFADGTNDYYIVAQYPTGSSITSKHANVFIDANPKPDYLTGVSSKGTADLSWYMPYGTPPHWACYYEPESTVTTIDWLDDGAGGTIPCYKRRVSQNAEDLGLYYPVYIDSVAAGFYEWDDDPWGTSNTYTIRLWSGAANGDSAGTTLLWESTNNVATPGTIHTFALDQTYELNGEWNVEVEANDQTNGFPSTMAGLSTAINSYFYYVAEASYTYYISYGDDPATYCIMSHVTSSDPPAIAKSTWTQDVDRIEREGLPIVKKVVDRNEDITITNPKAMDTYKIYRDGVAIGTSTITSYSDTSVATDGNYDYYVTASYLNPTGESAPSNTVNLFVTGSGGTLTAPANVVTSITGTDITISWDAVTGATSYNVYSSADPYGTYSLLTNVGTESYTVTTAAKLFYYITATDAVKSAAPKTINVKRTAAVK